MTLDQLVRSYMMRTGASTEHKYPVLLDIAIDGLRELHLDVSGIPKSVALTLDTTTYTCNLPDDYMNYTFIGFLDAGGNLIPLGLNNRQALRRQYDDCGDSTVSAGDISTGTGPMDNESHTRNGESIGKFFGKGGGTNAYGYYRVDREYKVIAFQSLNSSISQIWLEYIADPTIITSDIDIHPFDIVAMRSWMAFQEIVYNKKVSASQKEYARLEWVREKGRASRRHNSPTMDEVLQSFRKGNKQAPRF